VTARRFPASTAIAFAIALAALASSAEAKAANPLERFKGDAFYSVARSGSKIVAVGSAQSCRWSQGDCEYYPTPGAPLVARYTRSGKLDKRFNGTGFRLLDAETAYTGIIGVVVRPDRSLLIGYRTGDGCCKLVSLTRSGKLDRSFGERGRAAFPVTLFNPSGPHGLVALGDGRVAIPGEVVRYPEPDEFGVLAIDADGEVDTDFGDEGVATVGPPAGPLIGYSGAVALQRGRGILALGDTGDSPLTHTMTAARFKFDGGVDPTFGTDGITRFRTLSSSQIGTDPAGIIPFGREGIVAACDVYGLHSMDPDGAYPGSLFEAGPDEELPCIGLSDAVRIGDGIVAAGAYWDDYGDGLPHPWVRQFERTESGKLGPAEPRQTLPRGYRGFNAAVAPYRDGLVVAGSLLSRRCRPPWRPGSHCQVATLTRITHNGRDRSFGRNGIATLRKGRVCRRLGPCR